MAKLINQTQNITVSQNVLEAKTFITRSKGLLGKKSIDPKSCLWIHHCNSIHTWFMQFSIDVIFVNRKLEVCKVVTKVHPWKFIFPVFKASSVFEFMSGTVNESQVKKGDQLHVGP